MSKKSADTYQPKISRNDRFAQMSHQEKVIEQKKREILAKLEAKEKSKSDYSKSKSDSTNKGSKSAFNVQKEAKNAFSNDGSFLDQFKQLKDKNRLDLKLKSFSHSKDHHDKNHSDDRSKLNRWTPRRRSPSPKDRPQKRNFSRFSSDKVINFEPKITINTSFSSAVAQQPQSFDITTSLQSIVTPQDVTGQPLLKNMLPSSTITYPEILRQTPSEAVITAPPVLIDVPPPQIVQASQINSTLVLTEAAQPQQSVLVSAPLQPILAAVNLPSPLVTTNVNVNPQNALPVPPPCLPTVELASIPPPNPIQVQNIPQPEPINALNIPQPAPIQVQNIPTPNSIQLNEIPNPKPLDLLAIPTPNEDKSLADAEFIKNIPPPNKSVPPPQLQETTVSLLSSPQTVSASITVPSSQNVLVHNVPPQAQIQTIQTPHTQILQSQPTFSSVAVALPVGVVQVTSTPPTIPSLMAQPILPPPGMGLNVNVNCPPPLLSTGNGLQPPMTTFVNQVNQQNTVRQIPTINLPPPGGLQVLGGIGPIPSLPGFKNMNAVFPPGSAEYESMASLGRMVAECGQSIEDIVRQRKNQDPNLWFLFHKESAAYQQYRHMIEQFKQENEIKKKIEEAQAVIKSEDIYEPEKALEENEDAKVKYETKEEIKDEEFEGSERKRKKKSRWGEKQLNIAPPAVLYNQPGININLPAVPLTAKANPSSVKLSKVTRNDPGLIQYAINTYGSANLSEEDWKKAEDNYKINILYQDMIKKREEVERLKIAGKNKYEYDSDEETEGGTWEHKAREKEMVATQLWAQELTRQAEGKHHIGDFLPPEELKRFMEKSSAVKEGRQPSFTDYKEFKIKEDNIGFQMLQKLGWTEGQGLGSGGTGIVEPISKAPPREHTQGLGLNEIEEDEDEYESYRKRMMLAYRFRPNPLNNPRRPYY